jgi:hypothetical protein
LLKWLEMHWHKKCEKAISGKPKLANRRVVSLSESSCQRMG